MTVEGFVVLAVSGTIGIAAALADRHYCNANGAVDGVWMWKDGGPQDDYTD